MSKKIKLVMILSMVFLLTGCTEILKNSEGKAIQNEVTGQNLTKNILCQPESEDIRVIYQENGVDVQTFPKCSELPLVYDGSEGLWKSVFVRPLAWLLITMKSFLMTYGLSIIFVTILLRLIAMPLTKKVALQSEAMKEAKPELEKLEKKYKGNSDRDAQMKKAQEMLHIYKKYKINPMSGLLFALIQIPLFFAFYEAINRTPAIFESSFLGFQLGTTPWKAFSTGDFHYIVLIILIVGATYYSFKLNRNVSMNEDQEKQMKLIMNIMIIFICIASFTLPTAIGIYWIFNSGFTIVQNLIVKRKKKNV